jgi:hypothetical protein
MPPVIFGSLANRWTWMSGDNTRNADNVYGSRGVGTTTTKPGARAGGALWADATGNLWYFGGYNMGTDNFNDLWQFNPSVILPLERIVLSGSKRNNGHQLVWETTGEENISRFIVERSNNGTDYITAGTVPSAGNGNNRYTYTDNNLPAVTSYYRVQVVGNNGEVYYSSVVKLHTAIAATMYVYPNPASNYVIVQVSDNSLLNTIARLYNTSGNLVKTIRITSNIQRIQLQSLPTGNYALQLSNGKTVQVVKQ